MYDPNIYAIQKSFRLIRSCNSPVLFRRWLIPSVHKTVTINDTVAEAISCFVAILLIYTFSSHQRRKPYKYTRSLLSLNSSFNKALVAVGFGRCCWRNRIFCVFMLHIYIITTKQVQVDLTLETTTDMLCLYLDSNLERILFRVCLGGVPA